MRRKRTEITFETREVLIVRGGVKDTIIACETCSEKVQAWSPAAAAALTGVSCRLIYRWVESARVHFFENVEGEIFICNNSLSRAFRYEFQINQLSEAKELPEEKKESDK